MPLSATLRLIEMESDYGIMPIPKYTSDQKEYYCLTTGDQYTMPTCVSDPDKAALALECIGYYSLYMGGDSLNYAFYDLLAFARLCRDLDDMEMLKLVFASKTYDLEEGTRLTSIRQITTQMSGNRNYSNLFSEIDATKESSISKIRDFVVKVESNLQRN